jgi:hypothetical protein
MWRLRGPQPAETFRRKLRTRSPGRAVRRPARCPGRWTVWWVARPASTAGQSTRMWAADRTPGSAGSCQLAARDSTTAVDCHPARGGPTAGRTADYSPSQDSLDLLRRNDLTSAVRSHSAAPIRGTVDTRLKIAALWIARLFIFAYADLFSLYRPDMRADLEAEGQQRFRAPRPGTSSSCNVDAWTVSPRKPRRKSPCFSRTVTSMPARPCQQERQQASSGGSVMSSIPQAPRSSHADQLVSEVDLWLSTAAPPSQP